jgi:branched-subunit amino acid aminotransferase/4-amino-4-deoxychorismate lyase
MALKILTRNDLWENGRSLIRPWHEKYLAMFSSVYGGIVTDPTLMMLPADDHLVHRGDGVFDVAKCVEGGIYQLDGHLQRLFRSAEGISLNPPYSMAEVKDIIIETVRAGGQKNCLVRVTISRGPGGFSVDPSECPGSQLYVNVLKLRSIPEAYIQEGIRIIISQIPIKPSFFATVKSCNYLPNVLMALGAKKAGVHYAISVDEQGFLAEGAAENIGLLTQDKVLVFPEFHRILTGLTVSRISQLAERLAASGEIREIRFARLKPEDAYGCREFFLFGTSIDALPVVEIDGRVIGEGSPGPIAKRLRELIHKDMTTNEELITRVF